MTPARPLLARLLVALALVLLPAASAARDMAVFFWGHSLLNHPEGGEEASVPHWLALMAQARGDTLRADGASAFLLGHASALPPVPSWRLSAVPAALSPGQSWEEAGFDAAVLAIPNFLQHRDPARTVQDAPAEDLSAAILGWAAPRLAPGGRLLLYEGWPQMEDIAPWPPTRRGMARWRAWMGGGFADWHAKLLERLRARLPEARIAAIPTATTLAALLSEPPLEALPPEALFTDGAPHGTPTTYLLAAMIAHAALWGEPPPPLALPPSIHPLVATRYDALARRVAELAGLDPAADPPASAASLSRPSAGPGLGMGLNGISDWSTQHPFLDRMRTARPWIGHSPEQWGAWDTEALRAGGHLSPEGWPLSLPAGADRLESLVLTDQPEEAAALAGTYILSWEGRAEVSLAGLARDIRPAGPRAFRFRYAPGPGAVAVVVRRIDPADPPRDFVLLREEHRDLHAAGEVFDPDFLARIEGFRALRFMDWMDTNNSAQTTWEDRPRLSDATWAARGVPAEVMVDLANRVGADPWFTLPHAADDAYVRAFARLVHDRLDPRLVVHAEWSNEVWNWLFEQARWADAQARARWGADAPGDAWMQFAGLRAAEVADIWAETFADDPARLRRVVGVQTGWLGLEEPLLEAPLARAEGRAPPWQSFDAYAVTGYLGHGWAEAAPDLLADPDAAPARLEAVLRADLADHATRLWPHHAAQAARRGLLLVAYEAGPHIVPEDAGDERLRPLLDAFAYSPAMGALMTDLVAAWREAGGTLLMPFVDTAAPSRWGAWGALRFPGDRNPRWDAIRAAAEAGPWWPEARTPGTFEGREAGP